MILTLTFGQYYYILCFRQPGSLLRQPWVLSVYLIFMRKEDALI